MLNYLLSHHIILLTLEASDQFGWRPSGGAVSSSLASSMSAFLTFIWFLVCPNVCFSLGVGGVAVKPFSVTYLDGHATFLFVASSSP